MNGPKFIHSFIGANIYALSHDEASFPRAKLKVENTDINVLSMYILFNILYSIIDYL